MYSIYLCTRLTYERKLMKSPNNSDFRLFEVIYNLCYKQLASYDELRSL